ncbi:MAG: GAF domain-containing sensor histidine kinase [Proteobacteria bacterium]|nr:GAF domain-containing sensor histidine kinase [Pseudomonadota bacterium]
MSKLAVSEIISFLRDFNTFTDFEKKFVLIGDFLKKYEVEKAFLINDKTFEIKNILGDFTPSPANISILKRELQDYPLNRINLDNNDFGVIKIDDETINFRYFLYYPLSLDDDIRDFVSLEFSCLIKNYQNYLQLNKRQNEINTIKMLSEKVSTFYNLKTLLHIVTEYVTKSLFCRGTVIRLVNKKTGLLEVVEEFGLENVNIRRFGVKKGSGVSGQTWESAKPRLVTPDTEESKELLQSTLGVGSLICVPLIFGNEVIGTLSVYEKLNNETFTEEDKVFLEVIGSLISPIISYADALEIERNLRELINIYLKDLELITEINKIIMQPRRIDELLYIILTALTFGEDIGFNRAAIFTYNFNTETLQGMLGVGCEDIEETKEVWEKLPKNINSIKWLQEFSRLGFYDNSPFNEKIKALRFNINKIPELIGSLKKGKVYFSDEKRKDFFKEIFKISEYAIVPLIGKENLLGIIYVDNKFTNKKIDERYIRLLEIFGSQASIAIENSNTLSELKDANNMLKIAQQEILMKEKLAAVGEMLTTLAHEIRNPLTTIGGFSDILSKKIEDKNLRELAEKIHKQAQRMEKIFNSFLYLSKNRNFKKELINLKEFIINCVEQLGIPEDRNIKINFHFSDENITANIDKQMFSVIVENLIKNAVEAMPGGGNIDVTLGRDENFFILTVEDEGPGINKDDLPKIFDPFFTTKFNGFGIGLAISYKIIKQHNGLIYAENRKPKGARFVLKMPLG